MMVRVRRLSEGECDWNYYKWKNPFALIQCMVLRVFQWKHNPNALMEIKLT